MQQVVPQAICNKRTLPIATSYNTLDGIPDALQKAGRAQSIPAGLDVDFVQCVFQLALERSKRMGVQRLEDASGPWWNNDWMNVELSGPGQYGRN